MNNRDKNWKEYIDPRIDILVKNKFFLEAFYLCSAVIEHALQETIKNQEGWLARLLKKSNLRFAKTKPEELREKTLGQLIATFSRYCDDKELISKLNEFNSFRKTLTHYLLDNSIASLNIQALKKQLLYHELISGLSRYNMMILEKKIRSSKRLIHKKLSQIKTLQKLSS